MTLNSSRHTTITAHIADLFSGSPFFFLFVKGLTAFFVFLVLVVDFSYAFLMVKDRLPVCFVVLGKDATRAERYAAEELTKYIKEMNGAQIPVREMEYDNIPETGHAVLIGQGDWLDRQRFSDSAENLEILGPRSYIIRAYSDHEPECLIITGGTPRATVYAVYELLNRLGVRWYTPDITKIPGQRTINLGSIDICDFPCFPFRGFMPGYSDVSPVWIARLRLNAGPGFMEHELGCEPEYVSIDIPLGDFLPQEDPELHPALFPLVDGKRSGQFDICCFSNPVVLSAAADSIAARLTRNPSVTHVVLHPDESGLFCQCNECKRSAEQAGSKMDLMFSWVVDVADRVTRSFEHVTIELALPGNCTDAPKRNHFAEHVAVRISDEECDLSCPFEESIDERVMAFVQNVREWSLRAENVYVLHNIGHHDYPSAPFPDFDQTFTNTLMFRNEFVQGVFYSHVATPGILFADDKLRMWVLSQLLWNSDRNGEALVREWIKGVYGFAWGPMVDYRKHIREIAQAPDRRLTIHTDPHDYITEDWLNTAERIVKRGYAQSMTDSTAQRYVRKARVNLWLMSLLLARKKIESEGSPPDMRIYESISKLLEKWEIEMKTLGYERVSEHETAEQFAGSIRTAIDNR